MVTELERSRSREFLGELKDGGTRVDGQGDKGAYQALVSPG
jgi:hypothetical protein